MVTTYQFDVVLGDLLIYEGSLEYTRESGTYTNGGDAKVVIPLGQPVTLANGVITLLTGAALHDSDVIGGLLLKACTVQPGETVKLSILARGPAVVNQSKLPTVDYAGTAWTADDELTTAIAALSPTIVLRTEPVTQQEQDT